MRMTPRSRCASVGGGPNESSLMTLTEMHSLRDAALSVQQRPDSVAYVRHAPKLWQLVRDASMAPRADATMPPGAAA